MKKHADADHVCTCFPSGYAYTCAVMATAGGTEAQGDGDGLKWSTRIMS